MRRGMLCALACAAAAAVSFAAQPPSTAVAVSTAPAADARTNLQKLADPDPFVRRNAVIYLGAERKKSSFQPLVNMLADPSVDVRRAAVNALVQLNDPRAAKSLLNRFAIEKDMTVKMNMVVAFGDLKNTAPAPVLRTVLTDPYPQFRGEAVRALGKINAPGTQDDIIGMLNDEAEAVRIAAADAAGSLQLTAAVPLLTKNLSDPVPMVRRACVQALAAIGDPSAVEALKKVQNDPDMSVRTPALEAIDKLRKREPPAAPATAWPEKK